MVLRLVRQLLAVAMAALLVTAVTGHLGTSLAARSMSGYVASLDAAQRGDTARAESTGVDLSVQWHQLASSVQSVCRSVESALDQLVPRG